MPSRGSLDEPCKKNPRNKTKAQRGRGRSYDNANDSTNVLGEVTDIKVPDGRRVCEASHGQPRRHARCKNVDLCENQNRHLKAAVFLTGAREIPGKRELPPASSSHPENGGRAEWPGGSRFYCKGATDRNRCQPHWGFPRPPRKQCLPVGFGKIDAKKPKRFAQSENFLGFLFTAGKERLHPPYLGTAAAGFAQGR